MVAEFTGGAKRSERKPDYWQIPLEGLRLLAERYQLGAEKYTVRNWACAVGDPVYIADIFNHAFEHMMKIPVGGDDEEGVRENLAAALWGLVTLAWYYENDRESFLKAFALTELLDLEPPATEIQQLIETAIQMGFEEVAREKRN